MTATRPAQIISSSSLLLCDYWSVTTTMSILWFACWSALVTAMHRSTVTGTMGRQQLHSAYDDILGEDVETLVPLGLSAPIASFRLEDYFADLPYHNVDKFPLHRLSPPSLLDSTDEEQESKESHERGGRHPDPFARRYRRTRWNGLTGLSLDAISSFRSRLLDTELEASSIPIIQDNESKNHSKDSSPFIHKLDHALLDNVLHFMPAQDIRSLRKASQFTKQAVDASFHWTKTSPHSLAGFPVQSFFLCRERRVEKDCQAHWLNAPLSERQYLSIFYRLLPEYSLDHALLDTVYQKLTSSDVRAAAMFNRLVAELNAMENSGNQLPVLKALIKRTKEAYRLIPYTQDPHYQALDVILSALAVLLSQNYHSLTIAGSVASKAFEAQKQLLRWYNPTKIALQMQKIQHPAQYEKLIRLINLNLMGVDFVDHIEKVLIPRYGVAYLATLYESGYFPTRIEQQMLLTFIFDQIAKAAEVDLPKWLSCLSIVLENRGLYLSIVRDVISRSKSVQATCYVIDRVAELSEVQMDTAFNSARAVFSGEDLERVRFALASKRIDDPFR